MLSSLDDALAHDSDAEIYPEGSCTLFGNISGTPQACSDFIHFRALGAVTQPEVPWVNRPTFQQAVEIKYAGALSRLGHVLGRDRVAQLHRSPRERRRGLRDPTLDGLEDLRCASRTASTTLRAGSP